MPINYESGYRSFPEQVTFNVYKQATNDRCGNDLSIKYS